MIHRRDSLRARLALIPLACALFVTACKSKPSVEPSGPENVSSDLFIVAHLRAQELQKTTLFTELTKELLPLGAEPVTWDQFNQTTEKQFGIRPSHVDTITFSFPDSPDKRQDENKFILIFACQNEISKELVTAKFKGGQTNRSGFTAMGNGLLLHFPDPKTLVVVHEELADRYVAGYAKDRNAWPFNGSIRKAADSHTALVVVNFGKLPADARRGLDDKSRKLLDAKLVTLALDVKDKEINFAVNGSYHDESSAREAKDALTGLVKVAEEEIERLLKSPTFLEDDGFLVKPLEQVKRTLDEAKIEATGSDVKIAAAFKLDFSVVDLLRGSVQKVQGAAQRVNSMNNLKQIGIALYNYNDAMNSLPIHGVAAMGQPIHDLKGKPLLSWRVAILPYIEAGNLYQQFKLDEPWDSENNKKLIEKMPRIYAPPKNVKAPAGHTFYQMIIGAKAMRPGMNLQQIADGTSNTLAVVEGAQPVIWTKPDDIIISDEEMPKDLKKKFGGVSSPNAFLAMFWDGSVRSIDLRQISEKTLWALITPDGKDDATFDK